MSDPSRWLAGLIQFLTVLLALSLHEAARAWMADRLGDPTARSLGKVSLNPLRHLDPFGTVLLPIGLVILNAPVFGWARPAPVVTRNLRGPWAPILVLAAGPMAHFVLAGVASVAFGIAAAAMGPAGREAATAALQLSLARTLPVGDGASAAAAENLPLLFALLQLAYINGFLGVFHLLPLPPLAGGEILLRVMPPDWAVRWAGLRPWGLMISMALGMLGVVTLLTAPLLVFLYLLVQL